MRSVLVWTSLRDRSFCRTRLRATAGSACAAPPAPPPGYGAPISLEDAKKAAAGAEAEMKKNNWNLVIAIVDPSGDLVYLQKADLAAVASVTVAHEKAKSSATFRAPTKAFMDRLANGETYLLRLPGATPVAGGLPIVMGGKVVGAIGISGASAPAGPSSCAGRHRRAEVIDRVMKRAGR